MQYIIGIDGGGTKTEALIYDFNGGEIKKVFSGLCNISVDFDLSIKNIEECIKNLISGFDYKSIKFIIIGLAGFIDEKVSLSIENHIKTLFGIECSIVMDADIALYSIKKNSEENTVLVIGGTGSIVAFEEEGIIQYVGGYGHMIGDEGSSYHLVIKAIRQFLNRRDLSEEISDFDRKIYELFGVDKYRNIIDRIYGVNKDVVAGYAIDFASLAYDGFEEARELFINEGKELAKLFLKAISNMTNKENLIVGLRGSFLNNAPYVKESFIDELNNYGIKYKLEKESTKSVKGCFYLALRNKVFER